MIKVFHEKGVFLCSEITVSYDTVSFFGLNDNLKCYIKFKNPFQADHYFKSIMELEAVNLTKIDPQYDFVQKFDSKSLLHN